MRPVQQTHGSCSCRSPMGCDPRQAPLSGPQNQAVYHLKVKEVIVQFLCVISAVSNSFPLSPASRRPRAVPFLQIYKQAGRHDLKQKICTEAEKSSSSMYFNVPSNRVLCSRKPNKSEAFGHSFLFRWH